jgi:exopolysaccharide biosynthesis polyprenyl glycosylphosphotransferase
MIKNPLQFFLSFIYPLTDFVVVALSIMISYKTYRLLGVGQGVVYGKTEIIPISFLIAFASVIVMNTFGVYKRESSVLNAKEIQNTVKGATVIYLIVMMCLVFVRLSLSRYVIGFSYFISLALLIIEKTVFYHLYPLSKILRRIHKRILIYGSGVLGQKLCKELIDSPKLNLVPVGFVDDDPGKMNIVNYQNGFQNGRGISVIGTGRDIPHLVKELDIDEVYVAISNIEYATLANILDFLNKNNIKAAFVPNLHEIFVHRIKINLIGQIPLVMKEEESNVQIPYLYIKRFFDLILSLAILILICPLLLIISLAIKIDSRGRVIFTQDRVGKDGKIFKMYKFRSMFGDTECYAVNPTDQYDPRITRVGRFLRKTSLDELPQLINVLKGEMSLVGPRPEMPFIVATYNEMQRERLKVLPGITGLWQLSGDRKKAIHENMDYDIYYRTNMSFFLDVAISIETLIFAFRGI